MSETDYALQRLLELEEAIGNTETHYAVIVYKSQTHDAIITAISALKQQSEAERKIEKAREYCLKAISDIGHSQPYVDACEIILEILEGKAE